MKTLDEIPPTWSQILPAAARFQIVMATSGVLDKETGLVWGRQLAFPSADYFNASTACLNSPGGFALRGGWRLPTAAELGSLWDGSASGPPFIPAGHPFLGLQPNTAYWTANTTFDPANPGRIARTVAFNSQFFVGLNVLDKTSGTAGVWCVRGPGGSTLE